jgi:hypothetical protein
LSGVGVDGVPGCSGGVFCDLNSLEFFVGTPNTGEERIEVVCPAGGE